jgi:hypothetical protein
VKLFRVPAKTVITNIYHVRAETAEQAMHLVHDGEWGNEAVKWVEDIEGDEEVYYPDITEIKE